MSRTALILVGGGEHARVVAEAARSTRDTFDLLGFVDPAQCEEMVRRLKLARLGDDDALDAHPEALRVLGVGAVGISDVRKRIVARLPRGTHGWARVVHAFAWVSPTCEIGEGTVVMAGAVVQSGARIGAHCVINTGAVVEHDARIGDFAQLGPRAALGGGAQIGAGAYVGLGACIRDHIRVGSDVLVGMGASVVKDVPDGARVVGIPAKSR